MNELEQFKIITESSSNNVKYLPFECDFSDHSVIVCGKTDTAIKWAEKFLKAGFITATEFKIDEIPDVLKPYEFNLRYQSGNFESGDHLGHNLIIATATGDPERDQIIAAIVHDENIELIMSETPSRYANIRFPEDKTKIETEPADNDLTENKPVIELGVFEDEVNSNSTILAVNEIKENFSDFQFDLIKLKPYDAKKYGFDYTSYNNSAQELVNNSFDRGYNALFKEDVDLILVDAETAPNFFSSDIDFWPTLVKRQSNFIMTLSPKEKQFKGMFDWPPEQKVFCQQYVFRNELYSVLYDYYDGQYENFPKIETFKSSKELKEIYENNPDAVVVTSFCELLGNLDISFDYKDYNLELGLLPLAPVPLQEFKVGISRKDNQSKALKMLKTASQKINQEQSEMFIFENYYRNRLYPYYGKYMDFNFSGGFNKIFDGKFTFDGYAVEKHGRYIQCGGKEHDTMEEAILEMFNFITRAIIFW